jgi:hypothetical protein
MAKQIQMRNGTEIWVSDKQAVEVLKAINGSDGFIIINENAINPKDIVGIISENVAMDKEQKRRGLWQTQNGEWATRGEKLYCDPLIPSNDELDGVVPRIKAPKKDGKHWV